MAQQNNNNNDNNNATSTQHITRTKDQQNIKINKTTKYTNNCSNYITNWIINNNLSQEFQIVSQKFINYLHIVRLENQPANHF